MVSATSAGGTGNVFSSMSGTAIGDNGEIVFDSSAADGISQVYVAFNPFLGEDE